MHPDEFQVLACRVCASTHSTLFTQIKPLDAPPLCKWLTWQRSCESLKASCFFSPLAVTHEVNFARLVVGQQRFLSCERRERHARPQEGKQKRVLLASMFLDERGRYVGLHVKMKKYVGGNEVLSFRPTLGVARLVRQCESISASRPPGSSLPLCCNKVSELYPSLWSERAFKLLALCKVKLHRC